MPGSNINKMVITILFQHKNQYAHPFMQCPVTWGTTRSELLQYVPSADV